MIRSMTGYGKSDFSNEKRSLTIEIRSVNHRYLDINVKMPRKYNFAEEAIKNTVKQNITRGKVEVLVQIENSVENDTTVILNEGLLTEYVRAIGELNDLAFKIQSGKHFDESYMRARKSLHAAEEQSIVSTEFLAGLPEILKVTTVEVDEEEVKEMFAMVTKEAILDNISMREREGESLVKDLNNRVDIIRGLLNNIAEKAPLLTKIYKEKLEARVEHLLEGAAEVSEERITVEATILADKANITEEIVRMESHLDFMQKLLLGEPGSGGKKMDFLVQEMNRETNTIGSKANDLEITNYMLEMKSEIEKIREQIQNIE